MADSKITALTAISTVDPAADPLVIVDVSDTSMAASGTTKKGTINQLLGAGGTATLASATITGDLTVDTSTLKVDSANNKVGIGTTTIASTLTIRGTLQTNADYNLQSYYKDNGSTWLGYHLFRDDGVNYLTVLSAQPWALLINGSERYRIASDGVATWSNVGGVAGTAMTLNSTGLGVGASPTAKISCAGYSSANQLPDINIARSSSGTAIQTGPNIVFADGTSNNTVTLQNSQGRFGIWNYGAGAWNERLIVDANGNCGIGVTPSASHILSCAGPIGLSGTNSGTRTSYISNSGACSIYYTDGGGSGYFTDFGNLIIQPRTSSARSVVIATGSTTPVERAVVKSTGQVRFVPLAADPAGAESGDVYYNSTGNKLKCYNGTTWNDLF